MHALLIVEIEMFDKKVPTRQWSKYQCVGVVTALYGDKKADITVQAEQVEDRNLA